jgi:anti-sigma factor RsiW
MDGELGTDEMAQVQRHLEDCPACQREFRELKAISTRFKSELDSVLSKVYPLNLEQQVWEQIQKKRVPWWTRLGDLLVTKRFLVPATAVAAMFILFFMLIGHPTQVSGPSAIVDSFSGEISSAMILETPRSRQTIIWFTEPI